MGGLAMAILLFLAALICFYEYSGIVASGDSGARVALMLFGGLSVGLGLYTARASDAVLLVLAPVVALLLFFTLRPGDIKTVWPRFSALAMGIPYVAIPPVAVYHLRLLGDEGPADSIHTAWLWLPLIATWSNDTCAYFTGRAFGKNKLYEKVSPKKTWEGAIGGAAGAVAFVFLFYFVFQDRLYGIEPMDILAIGLLGAILAPLGDLAESLLKRSYDTKDSGGIIPGHGGILDRVDAVFIVAPLTLLYATVIRPLIMG